MTILHLVQKPQMRGAEIFAAQLATHTHRHGHTVILVAVFPGDMQLPFEGKTLNLDGKPGRRFWNIQAWRRLARIIRKERPDIIQANAGDTLKYAVFSKLLFRWKQPIIFRNASTISLYIKTWTARVWNGFLFRHTGKIISVSKTSAADFMSLFPGCRNKIVVIPIGIEETPVIEKMDTARHNGSGVAPVLVHVGGFTYEKNHIRLIAIFQKLLTIYPGAHLHLVGDGPLRREIEAIARQKRLNTSIRFYGMQKEVMPIIAQADVLLLPSIIEGLPGVILEAFYCKIPVVAYDVGGIGEVLVNNDTGYLVKKGDESAFVQAIRKVIENKKDTGFLVQNAYQLVIAGYLNKRIATRFMSVYESVIRHSRPTILHIIKSLGRGGAELLLPASLSKHDKKRFDFHYLYFLPWKNQVVPEIEQEGGAVVCFPARNNAEILMKARKIAAYVREHNIQLIHCHLPWAGIVGRLVGRLTGVPVVYTEHNKWERYHKLTYWMNKLSFFSQQQVIAVSGEVARSIKTHYRKEKPGIQVVRNGIDTNRFNLHLPMERDIRGELNIPAGAIVIGIACVFRAQKRLTVWLEIASRLQKKHPGIRFIIVGDGILRNEVHQKARELDMELPVYFAGLQTEMRPWLKAMDIFMMCSEFEGLPIALLEAMSMGCLPACTNAGGIPEVIQDEVNGLLVPVADPLQLVHRLSTLLLQPHRLDAMKEAASSTVVQHFSMDQMVDQLETIYDDIIQKNPRL